ncbi:hypothetical protein NMY22_g16822 [Coprinellus aureogranulatus]|nr:hypothetical protein NMY22_g16822 [Coprinellus aureogranulatus]
MAQTGFVKGGEGGSLAKHVPRPPLIPLTDGCLPAACALQSQQIVHLRCDIPYRTLCTIPTASAGETAGSQEEEAKGEPDPNPHTQFDSVKPCWEDDTDDEHDSDVDQDEPKIVENYSVWTGKKLQRWGIYHRVVLAEIAGDEYDIKEGEKEWLPKRKRKEKMRELRNKLDRKKAPTGPSGRYAVGPDVASKSARTQRRHRSEIRKQTRLDGYVSLLQRSDSLNPESPSAIDAPSDSEMGNVSDGFLEDDLELSASKSDVKEEESEIILTGHYDRFASPLPDVSIRHESTERFISVKEEQTSDITLTGHYDRHPSPLANISIREESTEPSLEPRIRQESLTPPPLDFDSSDSSDAPDEAPGALQPAGGEGDGEASTDEMEPWEDELQEALTANIEVRGWDILRDEIKKTLTKKHRKLTLVQINQLIILRNFATLRLKGLGRMQASRHIALEWNDDLHGSGEGFAQRVRALARHYQVYERLPDEKRGGYSNARSLLKDEGVRCAARAFLSEIPTGQVTPLKFQAALNEKILPALGISTAKPLCERTARRWLVKLGWTRTVLRKGVYMDGHERKDVVKYRTEVFLPKMLLYERCMAQYELKDGKLLRIEPKLKEGEKEIIACFQDESCFQANDNQGSVWLREGEQVLQKKGRGRLIHVSDFIEEVNGRLVVFDDDGKITRQARKIIYPGSNGDAWWDCKQLIKQVIEDAIPVFEAAHPGCQALFVFDQSSAHAALPDDALKAFEMNKSNGGAQRIQHDTVIPMTNPYPEFRGKPQPMTIPNPDDPTKPIAKGLKQVLEERGFDTNGKNAKCAPVCPHENQDCCLARILSHQDDFANQISVLEEEITKRGHLCLFLPKFHCELNPIEMYWGWAKYRYRQEQKPTFAHAKLAAEKWLDACPADVIRRFVNRSWRFMSAYRKGLTGKAAAWAVRKYKGHRAVSQGAFMNLEAVLNAPEGSS